MCCNAACACWSWALTWLLLCKGQSEHLYCILCCWAVEPSWRGQRDPPACTAPCNRAAQRLRTCSAALRLAGGSAPVQQGSPPAKCYAAICCAAKCLLTVCLLPADRRRAALLPLHNLRSHVPRVGSESKPPAATCAFNASHQQLAVLSMQATSSYLCFQSSVELRPRQLRRGSVPLVTPAGLPACPRCNSAGSQQLPVYRSNLNLYILHAPFSPVAADPDVKLCSMHAYHHASTAARLACCTLPFPPPVAVPSPDSLHLPALSRFAPSVAHNRQSYKPRTTQQCTCKAYKLSTEGQQLSDARSNRAEGLLGACTGQALTRSSMHSCLTWQQRFNGIRSSSSTAYLACMPAPKCKAVVAAASAVGRRRQRHARAHFRWCGGG